MTPSSFSRSVCQVTQIDDDHFHDECGVFGVFGVPEAANIAYLGLHSLQHRGQESAGVVSSDGHQLHVHRGVGLVREVFTSPVIAGLTGASAIGHVRYSTAGGSDIKNAQPFAVDGRHGSVAVAHNGNLTNYEPLRETLEAQGSIFMSSSDSEVFVHLVARSQQSLLVDRIREALAVVEGAYSLVFLSGDELVAVRDPNGFRPLCLGRLGDGYLISSEPAAFALVGGSFVRDIRPGEVMSIRAGQVVSLDESQGQGPSRCIFEHIYFARPDAHFDGIEVYAARQRLGIALAEEQPADVDVVIPVPDSGVAAAIGYARRLNLPYELGLIRSHYVGRTFIEPSQSIRDFGVRLKLHPVESVLRGKRVAVIDDSVVRGTTSQKIVRMLRESGAAEVHMRISSPPTVWPCFYGIDTPSRSELIASGNSVEDVARFMSADSLGHLSLEGLHRAVHGGSSSTGYCDACFSGNYPVELKRGTTKRRPSLVLWNANAK